MLEVSWKIGTIKKITQLWPLNDVRQSIDYSHTMVKKKNQNKTFFFFHVLGKKKKIFQTSFKNSS